jgi:glycosyltransferase involved in cell wall biosynthesis
MPAVVVDVGPLLETNWTGIPVFTARLVRMLLDDPQIDTSLMINGRRISRSSVITALEAMTGLYLRDEYHRGRCFDDPPTSPATKALFPTVKTAFGVAAREASVIHDLTTIVTPEFHTPENIAFHRSNLLKEVDSNEFTFAVSEATADDISLYLNIPREKIKVAYQFVDWPAEFNMIFESRYPADATLPYVLVIGTIEPRKNLRLVFSAAKEILKSDPELNILVLGKSGWALDRALGRDVGELVQSGRIRFTGFVDEFKKYCLLRMCRFTILPSLMEGFGIPVLESLDLGKPVLASFSSSIPEVGRDAVAYFDPLSKADFISAFARLHDQVMNDPTSGALAASRVAASFSPEAFYQPFRNWILS